MKVRTVSVQGLFHCYSHSLTLCGKGLTFIHSPNGVGKSTLLKLIYDLFRGNVQAVAEVPFDRMDVAFDEGTAVIVENLGGELRIQVQRNEVETEVPASELAGLLDVIYLSPERGTVRKMDGHVVPAVDAIAYELHSTLESAKSRSALELVRRERAEEPADGDLVFRCKDLKARLDFVTEAGFEVKMPPGLRFPPSRFDVSGSKEEYIELADALEAFIDANYELAESVIAFQDIVNGLFWNKRVLISPKNHLTVLLEDRTAIPLSKLSSGEKQVIIIFYRLLFHAKCGSLAIIDEPEISLHVSWQQKLGARFLDISRIRGVQILVATHSPQIIHDRWDYATELRTERARVPGAQGHREHGVDAADRLPRDGGRGGGRDGQEALRQVPRPRGHRDRGGALEGQRALIRPRGLLVQGVPVRRRHRGRRPGPPERQGGAAAGVRHRLPGLRDDDVRQPGDGRRHGRVRQRAGRGEVRARPRRRAGRGAGVVLPAGDADVRLLEGGPRPVVQGAGLRPVHRPRVAEVRRGADGGRRGRELSPQGGQVRAEAAAGGRDGRGGAGPVRGVPRARRDGRPGHRAPGVLRRRQLPRALGRPALGGVPAGLR